MKDFNSHLNQLDFSNLVERFKEKGKILQYKKKEYFVHQSGMSLYLGWVENGIFRYSCSAKDGREHIVGYSFECEFVGDYISFINKKQSLVNIQAVKDCTVYLLSYNDLIQYWEVDREAQNLRCSIVERLYETVYIRLLEAYCDTPEEGYLRLMKRCPDLKEKVPLKEIASFLRVTPETVSHIRKKILIKEKS